MLERLWKVKPHYLRLTTGPADKPHSKPTISEQFKMSVASAQWLPYKPERIFESLPEFLNGIHKADRYGSVVIEADADPDLRCAYPYDHRVFVMPRPNAVQDVFRDSTRAAQELRRVLDDTAAFASEIFGLFVDRSDGEPPEQRADLSATQMRGFLNSPLGDELATRIQLQQPYHGLVESDVIVVNSQAGEKNAQSEECIRRVRQLLDRVRRGRTKGCELFVCDPTDPQDTACKGLMQALKPMCQRGN
jgi:hypothetical protein